MGIASSCACLETAARLAEPSKLSCHELCHLAGDDQREREVPRVSRPRLPRPNPRDFTSSELRTERIPFPAPQPLLVLDRHEPLAREAQVCALRAATEASEEDAPEHRDSSREATCRPPQVGVTSSTKMRDLCLRVLPSSMSMPQYALSSMQASRIPKVSRSRRPRNGVCPDRPPVAT